MATVKELRAQARQLGIANASRANREKLEELIAERVAETREQERPKSKQKEAWTPEMREAMAQKMRDYYADKPGPMTGRKLSDESKDKIRQKALEREPIALCVVCGRPLSTTDSVRRGVGPLCAAAEDEFAAAMHETASA